MSEIVYPISCRFCPKLQYGPVDFCPYCGFQTSKGVDEEEKKKAEKLRFELEREAEEKAGKLRLELERKEKEPEDQNKAHEPLQGQINQGKQKKWKQVVSIVVGIALLIGVAGVFGYPALRKSQDAARQELEHQRIALEKQAAEQKRELSKEQTILDEKRHRVQLEKEATRDARRVAEQEKLNRDQAMFYDERRRIEEEKKAVEDAKRVAEQEKLKRDQAMLDEERRRIEEEKKAANDAEKPRQSGRAVDLVVSYYADLNRRDADSAINKWIPPRSSLRRTITNLEWFKVNDAQEKQSTDNTAKVSVDVTGRSRNENPQRWVGSIDLVKSNGEWKISQMNLQHR